MKTAFFDFDNTLTHGDTLPLWLASLRGWPYTIAAYALAGAVGWATPARGASDGRGRIKALLLRLAVRGVNAHRATGSLMPAKIKWRTDLINKLKQHSGDGCHIVVVTGAATLYVPALLAGLPVDEILGTELEIRDGKLTGCIAGVNCVRAAKAEAVRVWLARHRPEETWGYGNAPHDLEMLSLLAHHEVVR